MNGVQLELLLATHRVFFYLLKYPIQSFYIQKEGEIMASLKSIVVVACLLMTAGCIPPDGSLVDYTSCKEFLDDTDAQSYASEAGQECVAYNFGDDGILYLTHINADFNCCPDSLSGVVSIEDSIITIDEQAIVTTPCDCICLYDLDYEIYNLIPGVYTLDLDKIEDLRIELDLVNEPSGTYCVDRDSYPWW